MAITLCGMFCDHPNLFEFNRGSDTLVAQHYLAPIFMLFDSYLALCPHDREQTHFGVCLISLARPWLLCLAYGLSLTCAPSSFTFT